LYDFRRSLGLLGNSKYRHLDIGSLAEVGEVALRMKPEGWKKPPLPAAVLRSFGAGRVAYFPAAVDAVLWSYAYPYQRRLLVRAIPWGERPPAPILVQAPMCVQATYFTQAEKKRRRMVLHLFNGINTTAHHGLPAMDAPLREEVIAIHGIEVRFAKNSAAPAIRAVRGCTAHPAAPVGGSHLRSSSLFGYEKPCFSRRSCVESYTGNW
jgi:hypothetical protein